MGNLEIMDYGSVLSGHDSDAPPPPKKQRHLFRIECTKVLEHEIANDKGFVHSLLPLPNKGRDHMMVENLLLSGSTSGKLNLYHPLDKKSLLKSIPADFGAVSAMAMQRSYVFLVANAFKITVHHWKNNMCQSYKEIPYAHEKTITCLVKITPNTFASGSWDNTIRTWGVIRQALQEHELEQPKRILRSHKSGVRALCMINYDKQSCLVSAGGYNQKKSGNDTAIRIWDWQRGKIIKTLRGGHSRGVTCVMSMRIGISEEFLCSGGIDGVVLVWALDVGKPVRKIVHPQKIGGISCIINYSARILVCGTYGEEIWIWDWEKRQCLKKFSTGLKKKDLGLIMDGNPFPLCWLNESKDLLASGSVDKSVRVWKVTKTLNLKKVTKAKGKAKPKKGKIPKK